MKSCTLLIVQVVGVSLPCTYVLVAPKHQQSSQTPTKAGGFVRNGFMVFFHGIQSYGRLEINGFLPGCQCLVFPIGKCNFLSMSRKTMHGQLADDTYLVSSWQVGATSQFEAHDRKILITISKPQRSSCIFDLRSQFVYIMLQSLKLQVRHQI